MSTSTIVHPRSTKNEWHSRGYLPHFDAVAAVQSITFRLADSLPAHVKSELQTTSHPESRFEELLDKGYGASWLRNPEIADLVERALLHFDGERYRLLAWCIMPNHVHVMVEIMEKHLLSDVVHAWKGFTAQMANRSLRRSGAFWYRDYFDRYIRNEQHFLAAVRYIENNPVAASLCVSPELWQWSSAGRRSDASF